MQINTSEKTQIFLSVKEKPLIEKYGLLADRTVNYIYFGKKFVENRKAIYNIDTIIPGVMSVPIMCIMIAMYMGVRRIYLLGTEHSEVITRKYEHAFKYPMIEKADLGTVGQDGTDLGGSNILNFTNSLILFQQYRILHQVALKNNVEIYNATDGGILDEFPRVSFESLF